MDTQLHPMTYDLRYLWNGKLVDGLGFGKLMIHSLHQRQAVICNLTKGLYPP